MQNGRGTTSKNVSGNSYDRRRRREWMVAAFGVPRSSDGKKTRIRCAHCQKLMRADGHRDKHGMLRHTWEVDRFPTCGHDGGKYRRDNVVPSCRECNRTRCTTAKKCHISAGDFPKSKRVALLVHLVTVEHAS